MLAVCSHCHRHHRDAVCPFCRAPSSRILPIAAALGIAVAGCRTLDPTVAVYGGPPVAHAEDAGAAITQPDASPPPANSQATEPTDAGAPDANAPDASPFGTVKTRGTGHAMTPAYGGPRPPSRDAVPLYGAPPSH